MLLFVEKKEEDLQSELLDKAVDKFDYWMKHYIHIGQTNSKEMLNWLHEDSGGKLIANYKQFSLFATLLSKKGYDIPCVPSKTDFDVHFRIFKEEMEMRTRFKN